MSLPPLFASLPAELAAAYDPERPWELLGAPLDNLLRALPDEAIEIGLGPDARLLGNRIAIGRGSDILGNVVIEGPVWIGRHVSIRPGAYIRGGCWIGDGCVVGANSEIKHSILLSGAKAPHLAYVGDSIVGSEVNLGAGTILSNFRHDSREIAIPIEGERVETGRRKLGAVLGDGVMTGCNTVLSPGVIVGRKTAIYAGVVLRSGSYPEGSIVKLRQRLEIVPQSE